MILAITPQQARTINNCACYFTFARLKDAGIFYGRVKGHPFAANDVVGA